MQLSTPKNPNYCAVVVEITKIVSLENCDNVAAAIILGNSVIVSKDTPIGLKGLYFPAETQLSDTFLSKNNLYRDAEKNSDNTKTGYFEANRRIRTMAFRGHKSEGFFCPLEFLSYLLTSSEMQSLEVGQTFDHLFNKEICRKYVVATKQEPGTKIPKRTKKLKRFDRLIPGQFNLHIDTLNARINFHKLKPDQVVSISNKMHGTSFVVGNVKVKKKLSWWERLLQKVTSITDETYDIIWASRNVVKNKFVNSEVSGGYYGYDLWNDIAQKLRGCIPEGITLYGEAVGQLPSGKWIQPGYDYGTKPNQFETYIYRITFTNPEGKVFEFSWPQIQEFCKKYDLKMVQTFYYGLLKDYAPQIPTDTHWHENMQAKLEKDFMLDRNCPLCTTGVPEEGIVIRPESLYVCEPLKIKNFRFLKKETELLDKGFIDMESSETVSEDFLE